MYKQLLNPTDWLTEVGGPLSGSVVFVSAPFCGGSHLLVNDIHSTTHRRVVELDSLLDWRVVRDEPRPVSPLALVLGKLKGPDKPVVSGYSVNIPSLLSEMSNNGSVVLVQFYPCIRLRRLLLEEALLSSNTLVKAWASRILAIPNYSQIHDQFVDNYQKMVFYGMLHENARIGEHSVPLMKPGQSILEWGDDLELLQPKYLRTVKEAVRLKKFVTYYENRSLHGKLVS
jgi:hypothetical protein